MIEDHFYNKTKWVLTSNVNVNETITIYILYKLKETKLSIISKLFHTWFTKAATTCG